MRVVGTEKIFDFVKNHTDVKKWLQAWLAEARSGNWQCPQDIKDRFQSASFLGKNIVIFNIKGNKYRMEVKVAYNTGVVLIDKLGTHSEYDRWEKKGA